MADEREDFEGVDWEALKVRPKDWIRQEGTPIVYTNTIQISMSYSDIAFGIGLVEEATSDRFVAKEQFRIVMSPQHAKILSGLLAEKMEMYERTFGPLPKPPA